MYSEAEMIALIEKIYDTGGAEEKELDALATLQALPNLWETLAVLHADGAISISVIERMWGAPVLYAWQTWEKPVVRLRELSPPPPPYKNFEELAELLKTRQKKSKPN